jgi:hypothetical protein
MPFRDEIADATMRAMELFVSTTNAVAEEVVRKRGSQDDLHWKDVFGHLPRRELWDANKCLAIVEVTMQTRALRVTGFVL